MQPETVNEGDPLEKYDLMQRIYFHKIQWMQYTHNLSNGCDPLLRDHLSQNDEVHHWDFLPMLI